MLITVGKGKNTTKIVDFGDIAIGAVFSYGDMLFMKMCESKSHISSKAVNLKHGYSIEFDNDTTVLLESEQLIIRQERKDLIES